MKKCLLFIPRNHRLFYDATTIISKYFEIVNTVDEENFTSEESLMNLEPDFVCSFLNQIILKGPFLDIANVNFHPAPPKYPGRGGASLALFNDEKTYGATAHKMTRQIDAGEIYSVSEFQIDSFETCESLYARAEISCLDLLNTFCHEIKRTSSFPKSLDIQWKRSDVKTQEFQEWLILDPSNTEEFHKKVKAAKHPKFPGPYIIVNGLKFSLCT
jgi:methionyl-tRNA formyltransferase